MIPIENNAQNVTAVSPYRKAFIQVTIIHQFRPI